MVEMTREEAAEVLTELKQRLEMSDDYDYYYYSRDIDAYDTALAALRSGWVKTADRVPEKRDGAVIFIGKNEIGKWFHTAGQVTKKGQSKRFRDELEQKGYTHWMTLPEVEG